MLMHNQHQLLVSTHSRPKAAAFDKIGFDTSVILVSTHSRPKAAALRSGKSQRSDIVSTHSRPKAAACLALR